MAYSGTTAGSTLANPPVLMASAMGGKIVNNGSTQGGTGAGAGCNIWLYTSTNGTTEFFGSNYFSDAYYIGMRAGDVVICVGDTASTIGLLMGIMGPITTAGGAIRSTGTMISSTFG